LHCIALQCEAQAAAKKLNGAAKNSSIQKCVKTYAATDKAAQCEKAAADKKAGFCADTQGISMGLTQVHLGDKAQDKLVKMFGSTDGAIWAATP
jgi:hypothetical protein